jgi:hypothetical protein
MSASEITDGFSTPTTPATALSVRCDAYSSSNSCNREVVVASIGNLIGGPLKFVSDHVEQDGLALYAFCERGHMVVVSHIDTIPVLGLSPSSFERMSEGAIDLRGLNNFISSLRKSA